MNTNVTSPAKTDLENYDNSWYKQPPRLKALAWWVVSSVFINSPLLTPYRFKAFVLRCFGAKIGRGVALKPQVIIKYPWLLSVGDFVWIGEHVWIDNLCPVVIGNNACLSQGAMLLTGNHNYTSTNFDLMVGQITIDEGVWIGAKAIVCPGVHCRSHAVLCAGSVATKNLEQYQIYQGNPAVFIKERTIKH